MLVKTNGYDVTGNMPGMAMDMSLSSDSLEHIMDILSDLYSNRPAAIVREYATNAMDSHLISGQIKPIEIQTPSRLNPNLVIRDFGRGMSKQVLIDTYSKYGASTKRTNNLEAGQLGLGSKSGFAYTDQFTVRSVSEGHCCEIIMSRNDRGAAEMTIAIDYETTDPSGVTITIPVKSFDVDAVEHEVKKFATYAKPGTVAVNGEVNQMPDHWEKIADDLYASNQIDSHMVVMGNVAYPVKLFNNVWLPYNADKMIAFVEMGAVDFVPSREALKYTRHTNQTIAGIEKYLLDSITEQVNELVANADSTKSKVHAYKLSRRWDRFFPNGAIVVDFREDIEKLLKGSKFFPCRLPRDITKSMDRVDNGYHSVLTFDKVVNYIDKEVVAIVDFPGDRVSRDQARKILAVHPELAGEHLFMFESASESLVDIFDDWTFYNWGDFKKVRVPRPKSNSTKTKTQDGNLYLGTIYHKRRATTAHRMMKVTGPSYYCSQTEFDRLNPASFPREDFKLFFVIPSRQEVFARKNPGAKNLVDYIDNRRVQIDKHVQSCKSVREALPYAYDVRRLHRAVDFSFVTNEEFINLSRKAQFGKKWANLSSNYYSEGKFQDYITKNFPLVRLHSFTSMLEREHAAYYINMIGEKNVNA